MCELLVVSRMRATGLTLTNPKFNSSQSQTPVVLTFIAISLLLKVLTKIEIFIIREGLWCFAWVAMCS